MKVFLFLFFLFSYCFLFYSAMANAWRTFSVVTFMAMIDELLPDRVQVFPLGIQGRS